MTLQQLQKRHADEVGYPALPPISYTKEQALQRLQKNDCALFKLEEGILRRVKNL